MKMLFIFFCGFILIVSGNEDDINTKEYCNAEYFNPKCPVGKIIIVSSALLGRMSLGRCLRVDHGNMGCQSDVLAQLDNGCSGRQTCNLRVAELSVNLSDGCAQGLLLYLEASYKCVKEQPISSCSTSDNIIKMDTKDSYISSRTIGEQCARGSRKLIIAVEEGQTMNISLINLEHGNGYENTLFGSILDASNGKQVVFGNGPREKYLMSSHENKVELSIQESSKIFLLDIQVIGCKNMAPPSGAWMTRNGDIMELGCHNGEKSWSLKCVNNTWIGAVGQCGDFYDKSDQKVHDVEMIKPESPVSINAAVFGVSSLIILISAILFLIGVCTLKRSVAQKNYLAAW